MAQYYVFVTILYILNCMHAHTSHTLEDREVETSCYTVLCDSCHLFRDTFHEIHTLEPVY